jgi:hypothetical protein
MHKYHPALPYCTATRLAANDIPSIINTANKSNIEFMKYVQSRLLYISNNISCIIQNIAKIDSGLDQKQISIVLELINVLSSILISFKNDIDNIHVPAPIRQGTVAALFNDELYDSDNHSFNGSDDFEESVVYGTNK